MNNLIYLVICIPYERASCSGQIRTVHVAL